MITHTHIRTWTTKFRDALEADLDELNKLDAALGDGDYGSSMLRGFDAVAEKLPEETSESIGPVLQTVGRILVAAIGGTSGPLAGSLFLQMGTAIGDVAECDLEAFGAGVRAGVDGVKKLGGAEVGDKTMVDALVPAADAAERAVKSGLSLEAGLKEIADFAAKGAAGTKELKARRGRASYTGTGGLGALDPGAQGTALLFQTLVESV